MIWPKLECQSTIIALPLTVIFVPLRHLSLDGLLLKAVCVLDTVGRQIVRRHKQTTQQILTS